MIGALEVERVWYEREALALNVALPRLRLILVNGCHNICNRLPWFRANVITADTQQAKRVWVARQTRWET